MTELIASFRNFGKAPVNGWHLIFSSEVKNAMWLSNTLWGMSPSRPLTYATPIYAIADTQNFRKVQTKINTIFKTPNFHLRELKSHGKKVEEEYCWAITKAERLSGSSLLEFGFQLDCIRYKHKCDHTHIRLRRAPDLTQHNNCEILSFCTCKFTW
jgi:hypothetical protein